MKGAQKRGTFILGILAALLLLLRTVNSPLFGISMSCFTLILMGIQIGYIRKEGRSARFTLAAFLFVLTGDIFLNFTTHGILHIASFALSVILLTVAFSLRTAQRGSLKPLSLIAVLSAFLYGIIVVPALPHKLAVHFGVYLFLLTLMVWRAYLLRGQGGEGRVLFAGALLFYITDILVGVRILYRPELINIPIYLFYPVALILLVIAPWFRRR